MSKLERSWLKDALDRALAEPDSRPTAVEQFIANIILHGNPDGPTPTQYRGLKNKKEAA